MGSGEDIGPKGSFLEASSSSSKGGQAHSLENMSYDHNLEKRIAVYASKVQRMAGRALTLERVCRHCSGAFPTEVLAALARLRERNVNISVHADPSDSHILETFSDGMPEPHPANYEWRFTPNTARSLARQATRIGSSVVCLGTPTVFVSLRKAGHDAILIDHNPLLSHDLPSGLGRYMIDVDLNDVPFSSGQLIRKEARQTGENYFDVAIIDPPWYPSHARAWISAAMTLIRPGGTIISTLFPRLTRPLALQQSQQILSDISAVARCQVRRSVVEYSTPLFEKETLSAFGLGSLARWRIGDLLIAQVHSPQPLAPHPQPQEPDWKFFRFGTQVVAFRGREQDRTIWARPPYDDGSFLMKSVSARDTLRSNITLWTSRNRALIVGGGRRIERFLYRLSYGEPVNSLISLTAESESERHALAQIQAVIGW